MYYCTNTIHNYTSTVPWYTRRLHKPRKINHPSSILPLSCHIFNVLHLVDFRRQRRLVFLSFLLYLCSLSLLSLVVGVEQKHYYNLHIIHTTDRIDSFDFEDAVPSEPRLSANGHTPPHHPPRTTDGIMSRDAMLARGIDEPMRRDVDRCVLSMIAFGCGAFRRDTRYERGDGH